MSQDDSWKFVRNGIMNRTWGRGASRGSAQTQTGTEKENQDPGVGEATSTGAPDSAPPGPPGPGPLTLLTVTTQASSSEHRPRPVRRSVSDRGSTRENGRRTLLRAGHVSDDTCSEWPRDTCRVRSTACRDSLTVVCVGSDIKEAGDMTSDKAMVSSGETGGFKRNSFLRRSDSYRRAKNVLSPDLSKHNRKSVEVVSLNNNSSAISRNNPSHLKSGDSPAVGTSSPAQTSHQPTPQRTEKQATKGNFFRSLRSSLSFSSLRVKKSQPRPAIHISSPLEASRVSNDCQVNTESQVFYFPPHE